MSVFSIIQWEPSPNQMDREGWTPDMIVSHIAEGGFDSATNWLCNPASGASSHFVVSKKGEIRQLVDIRKAAWINGTKTDPDAKNFYGNSLLPQVRSRKTNANYYSIGIEHEGFYRDGKGALTEAQLAATIWLHQYIINEVKTIYGKDILLDREHIVGHYQVDPIRKPNCPGPNFQWDVLMKALSKPKIEEEEEEDMVRYNKLSDIPNNYGFRDVIDVLMDAKIVNGDGSDKLGNNDVINLSDDQVRVLVFNYRGGAYDRKLISMGMTPVIKEI